MAKIAKSRSLSDAMPMFRLLIRMEQMKRTLAGMADRYGRDDLRVLKFSQKLDAVHNEFEVVRKAA